MAHTPVYLDAVKLGHKQWPVAPLIDGIPDIENVTAALREGPYGQCVYEASNNVNDNQVVNILFSNGATVSFTLVAFTEAICERQVRLHFTHGEITGDMTTFTVTDFRTGSKKTHNPPSEGGGHGGGDLGLVRSFVNAVKSRDQSFLGTNISEILRSHLTVFAGEQARNENRVVNCVEFERQLRTEYRAAHRK
jgi:predicted dehydrogenase